MGRSPLLMWVWYLGHPFAGFQRQQGALTVQSALEETLRGLQMGTRVIPAGRTDKGVHARMQVVCVPDAPERLTADELRRALRSALPSELRPSLGIAVAARARARLHPQWSACSKEYRYRVRLISRSEHPDPFAWDLPHDARVARAAPDLSVLGALLAHSVGTHDFYAFHEKSSSRRPRTLSTVTIDSRGDQLIVRLVGSGFARYQVRYLVGSAVAAACGLLDPTDFLAALTAQAPLKGVKAPAQGLTLWSVQYPAAVDPFAEWRDRGGLVPDGPPLGDEGEAGP